MTLSRIHLPSITSVLTSERVFLPGQFQSTKLDMGATETECLLSPDFLMRTIHLDEAPCVGRVGHQVSSFDIGHNLDTIVEKDASDAMTVTEKQHSTSRGTSPRRSSGSSNNLKHDRGVLDSALRILYSIRSFARRRVTV